MKKIKFGSISIVILILVIVVACCSSSSDKKERPAYPHSIPLAHIEYGRLSKYVDGNNTIYIYERGGGSGSITVVSK